VQIAVRLPRNDTKLHSQTLGGGYNWDNAAAERALPEVARCYDSPVERIRAMRPLF
jgi:hypothetical protein